MSSRSKITLVLQLAIFLIPMNIYVIGDWMGTGIQWIFLRYVQIMNNSSVILLYQEIGLVVSGILTGKSAIASVIWSVGVILVVVATILVVYGTFKTNSGVLKKAAFVNLFGAVLFLLSIFVQYGIFFHGSAGIAIPFGIIVLFVIVYWQYRISCVVEEDSGMNKEESGIARGVR
jgi:hypothetical protein